ncbi:MAG: hypothetical protein AAGI51_15775 [Pseudomonadota bacterium]
MTEPRFRPATEADAPGVAALLTAHMNPKIPPEVFARILDYRWAGPKPHAGIVAEAEGEVVGYHGNVWSMRRVDGRERPMGSFSSLYVRRDWRGHDLGLRMMRSYAAMPEPTFTVFNPSRRVHAILEDCGFRDLDTHRRVWRAGEGGSGPEVVSDPAEIAAAVSDEERRYLHEHDGLPVRWRLLKGRGAAVLCGFLRQDRGEQGLCWDMIYGGDPETLAALIDGAAPALLAGEPRGVLQIDARFLGGHAPAGGALEPLRYRRMARRGADAPADHRIDHLYSETLLLGLKIA